MSTHLPPIPKDTGSILRNVFGIHTMPRALQPLMTGNIKNPSSIKWKQDLLEEDIEKALEISASKSPELKKVLYLYMIIAVAHSTTNAVAKDEYEGYKLFKIIIILKYAELFNICITKRDILDYINPEKQHIVINAIDTKYNYILTSGNLAGFLPGIYSKVEFKRGERLRLEELPSDGDPRDAIRYSDTRIKLTPEERANLKILYSKTDQCAYISPEQPSAPTSAPTSAPVYNPPPSPYNHSQIPPVNSAPSVPSRTRKRSSRRQKRTRRVRRRI